LLRTRGHRTAILLGGCALLLLFGPAVLEAGLIFVDVTPALFALLIVGSRLAWLRWRSGGLINSLSGLPNLAALRAERALAGQALVAARIHNYAEIASTLGPNEEAALTRQLVQRLTIAGGAEARIYQGDEGIFAWFVNPGAPLADHLEALHALFRSPLSVGGQTIDAAVTFGVELGSARPLQNRLGSALVAVNEAWDEGLKWKYHDPSRQEEVGWRLSLLGQLDAAIDNGEVWVAYQPQLDLSRQQIVGAEALARWTHPVKGPISPVEFIAAAEQQGRIGKLTDFVLDRAIATAAAINRRGLPFTVAVNISARLLSDKGLVDRVQRLLRAHGLAPERLTLELTETEALQGSDNGPAVLEALSACGIRIAIDDYGTGLSTLEYLRKVPADEIKIDQTFVKAMRHNRSDLIMVQSTIALAHSLNRTVVAEGVEDRALLEQLAHMECDVAQGYAIGRPMGVRELVQHLRLRAGRRVA
jgi:EAL domain-containing protein (putative c-di-GMP-specific phosphodiesterase class I)